MKGNYNGKPTILIPLSLMKEKKEKIKLKEERKRQKESHFKGLFFYDFFNTKYRGFTRDKNHFTVLNF